MDYYAVLGVEAGCSSEELQEKYLLLTRLYGQGASEDDERSTKRLLDVEEAYAALSTMPRKVQVATQRPTDDALDLPHASTINQLWPGYSQPAGGMGKRVAVYALIFLVLTASLAAAIRRGYDVEARQASSSSTAAR